ncbi:hypothetical protein PBY51_021694 [Eleginops maclovinus]|uniref:Uncharacterized protein n=1 Tax=Eleginops maclovinus TaxID=56733 RepID=A0AAN7XIE4_ELEMC|nr:hypothetical protein PBY51_021694 [Eleginops maclovinus]
MNLIHLYRRGEEITERGVETDVKDIPTVGGCQEDVDWQVHRAIQWWLFQAFVRLLLGFSAHHHLHFSHAVALVRDDQPPTPADLVDLNALERAKVTKGRKIPRLSGCWFNPAGCSLVGRFDISKDLDLLKQVELNALQSAKVTKMKKIPRLSGCWLNPGGCSLIGEPKPVPSKDLNADLLKVDLNALEREKSEQGRKKLRFSGCWWRRGGCFPFAKLDPKEVPNTPNPRLLVTLAKNTDKKKMDQAILQQRRRT